MDTMNFNNTNLLRYIFVSLKISSNLRFYKNPKDSYRNFFISFQFMISRVKTMILVVAAEKMSVWKSFDLKTIPY